MGVPMCDIMHMKNLMFYYVVVALELQGFISHTNDGCEKMISTLNISSKIPAT